MELHSSNQLTLSLATQDARRIIEQQKEERQFLYTQINILFVTNTALLSILALSKLLPMFNLFTAAEVLLSLLNFTLLFNALLPRQFIITPNLENTDILAEYLSLSPEAYQIRMLVNLVETYNINQQPLNDISQSLSYAAVATWSIAFIALMHMASVYFLPNII